MMLIGHLEFALLRPGATSSGVDIILMLWASYYRTSYHSHLKKWKMTQEGQIQFWVVIIPL